MKTEYICTLHSEHDCTHRRYNKRDCELQVIEGYATSSCIHRMEAVELAAAEKEESPVNVEQQGQPVITATAESMQSEIEKIF